jgi:hypothetical protein
MLQLVYGMSPQGIMCWGLGPQLVVLLWKALEILGVRISLEKVGPWEQVTGAIFSLAINCQTSAFSLP